MNLSTVDINLNVERIINSDLMHNLMHCIINKCIKLCIIVFNRFC